MGRSEHFRAVFGREISLAAEPVGGHYHWGFRVQNTTVVPIYDGDEGVVAGVKAN